MILLHADRQTDRQTDGHTDGKTDAQKEDRSTDGLTDNQATLGWHPKQLYLVVLHVMLGPSVRPNMLKNVYLAIGEFSPLSVLRPVVATSIVETSCKSLTAISQTRLLYNGCC